MIPILQDCWWDLVSKTWFCCVVDLALGFLTPVVPLLRLVKGVVAPQMGAPTQMGVIPTPVQLPQLQQTDLS